MAIDPARQGELVALTNLQFVGVCPHHLLPYAGVAHIAYVPGRHLVGFGQIVQVVECLSRRFALQEELAKTIAFELQAGLEARGVAVMLEAQQSCLALRGERQHGANAIAEAYAGSPAQQRDLRVRFSQVMASRSR
jgi:GTP cyclohydrolase I